MNHKILRMALAAAALAGPFAMHTSPQPQEPAAGDPGTRPQQTSNPATDDATKNAAQARAILDAMVKAMGGDAWLKMKNQYREGHVAAFFHSVPAPGTTKVYEYHSWPDHDRIEFTTHRDVVQFIVGRAGWEVTYKGKAPLPADQVDDYLRRRDHSVEAAVKVWMKDPNTILINEGQKLAGRHLAEQVTLISAQNEAVTIQVDSQTHLPLSRSFQWRDPVYKDKNTDREEYDGYHEVNGFPTPYTITRLKNDEIVRQFFLDKAAFNQDLPPDIWDADAASRRIKK